MRKALAAAAATLAALAVALPAGAATSKYTFSGATFSDGTTGDIQAGVKTTKNGTVVVCNYVTPNGEAYLGQFETRVESTQDEEAVEALCVAHYSDPF